MKPEPGPTRYRDCLEEMERRIDGFLNGTLGAQPAESALADLRRELEVENRVSSVAHSCVVTVTLDDHYRAMTNDSERESEAAEWTESLVSDIGDDER